MVDHTNDQTRLTDRQAYEAMCEFLARFYERAGSDDVGALLGDLQMLDDRISADPAAIGDWRECVVFVRNRSGREAAE